MVESRRTLQWYPRAQVESGGAMTEDGQVFWMVFVLTAAVAILFSIKR